MMNKPSPRMMELIEFIVANPLYTYRKCAELCGIPESTFDRWRRNDMFMDELKKRLREKWEEAESMAIENMQSLGREGNYQALKYILDSLNYAPESKLKVTNSSDINININITDGAENGSES